MSGNIHVGGGRQASRSASFERNDFSGLFDRVLDFGRSRH